MAAPRRAPLRDRLYEVIFKADTPAGQWFDIVLLVAILASVAVVCLETVGDLNAKYGEWFLIAEWIFTILFTVEYILRLYCAHRPGRYAISFYGLVDLFSFLPTYYGLFTGGLTSFAVVRSFRLLRVFRIMKLIRLSSEAEDLAAAVWRARGKVVVFLMVVMITVTIAGTAMYEVERGASTANSQFTSIPQSVYWAIVTMTTVGYGDIVPQTTLGKTLSAALIVIGYSLIIVPTGFVSAEIVRQRSDTGTPRSCPQCGEKGHASHAKFCRVCGERL